MKIFSERSETEDFDEEAYQKSKRGERRQAYIFLILWLSAPGQRLSSSDSFDRASIGFAGFGNYGIWLESMALLSASSAP